MRLMRTATMLMLLIFGLQTATHADDSFTYKLAYISYSDNHIWTVEPDGTNAQPITNDGADKHGLVASPDGKYLAYYTQTHLDNTNYLNDQVVILDRATGQQRMITTPSQEVITTLTWSPDSQQLLFAVRATHADFTTSDQVFIINRDGSGRNLLDTRDSDSAGTGFVWSPDGKHILFSSQNTDSGYQISVLDANGRNAQVIQRFDSCFICTPPQWTPDGQHIVFYRHPDLFIMDADGQHQRQLTDFAQVYNVTDVAYARYGPPSVSISADSQTLYYTMGYPVQIVKLDLDQNGWSNRTILYNDQTHIISGSQLSPDGKLLFFNADSSQGNLLSSFDLATHEIRVLANHVSQAVFIAAT